MKRVFISHRIGEPTVTSLIEDLVKKLDAAGLDVLLDTERLEAGDSLRQEVFTWMGVCHAAIIILSPGALAPDSQWVPLESSVLAWRKTLNPDFVLIPILTPGVAKEALRQHERFRELGLDQLLHVPHVGNDETCAAVQSALAGLGPEQKSPLEDLSEQIEALLGDVRDDFLDEIIRLAGPDWRRPLHHPQKVRAAALALLEVPLARAVAALEYLSDRMSDAAHVDRVLEIIAPNWVNLAAARWIAACATGPAPRLAAVINARSGFAAQMYVRRASSRPPKTMWRMINVTAVHGELAHEDISMEIASVLRVEFQRSIQTDPFAEDTDDQQLERLLQGYQQSGRPVVMVIRFPQGVRDLVPILQSRFPFVTFLFLSGEQLPRADDCPATLVRRIEPALEPGEESKARDAYNLARSVLCT